MDYRFKSKAMVLYAVFAMSGTSCASGGAGIPLDLAADNAMVSALIPGSSSIRLQERGDLDFDGDTDVLVVLERVGDAPARSQPRALLIFQRTESGALEMAAMSPKAILCQTCGGAMGDPLQGIDPMPGGFRLGFEGGSRELWQREYKFSYSTDARTWVLDAISTKVLDRLDGTIEQHHTEAPALKPMPIEEFDPREFLEDRI